MRLAEYLPVIVRHAGVWEGTFARIDADNNVQAKFRSQIVFRLLDDAHWPDIYLQTNTYWLPGGSVQSFDTPGSFRDGRLWFESDRVRGWSADDPLDTEGANALLFMEVLYDPGTHIYEMAQISRDNTRRSRAVQFVRDAVTIQRTLIDETLLTRDWRAFDQANGR
jgi:hypothetical protein